MLPLPLSMLILSGQLSAIIFTEYRAIRALGDGCGYKYGKDPALQEPERKRGHDRNETKQHGGQARASRHLWMKGEGRNNFLEGSGKTLRK